MFYYISYQWITEIMKESDSTEIQMRFCYDSGVIKTI